MNYYAINTMTGEHRKITNMREKPQGVEWKVGESDGNGWIAWEGGECPLPYGHLCDIKYLSGHVEESIPVMKENVGYGSNLMATDWDHGEHVVGTDIIAYRPVLKSEDQWKIGDLVDGGNGNGVAFEILAIHEDKAWLKNVDRPYSSGIIYSVEDMEPFKGTLAQIKEDEIVEEWRDYITSLYREGRKPSRTKVCRDIYKGILKGEIRGVSMEHEEIE